MTDELKLTAEGDAKLSAWAAANARLREAKAEVNSAETDLANAINDLGKWIVPNDAKDGEQFNIWYVDGLLSIKKAKDGMHDYDISVRQQGRELNKKMQGIR